MAWPRNGLVILNNADEVNASTCTSTPPAISCTPSGSVVPGGGTGGTGGPGNPLDPTIVAETLYTNMNVLYHKINLELTKTNIYGEALEKWYYQPVNVRCTIERGETTYGDDEYGVTIANTIKVNIPKALLVTYNFLPEVGDIIMDRERYYEINSIDTQFVTLPGVNAPNATLGTSGHIVAYTLSGYLTRITKLNIIPYYQ
jgi:hypothetical protein